MLCAFALVVILFILATTKRNISFSPPSLLQLFHVKHTNVSKESLDTFVYIYIIDIFVSKVNRYKRIYAKIYT